VGDIIVSESTKELQKSKKKKLEKKKIDKTPKRKEEQGGKDLGERNTEQRFGVRKHGLWKPPSLG